MVVVGGVSKYYFVKDELVIYIFNVLEVRVIAVLLLEAGFDMAIYNWQLFRKVILILIIFLFIEFITLFCYSSCD